MERQLAELGLEAEFIPAVDGRHFSDEQRTLYDEARAKKRNGAPLAPGELGAALSHRSIYERMVREGIERALVLEDDVRLDPRIAGLLRDEPLLASARWSWLQLDYPEVGRPFLRAWLRSSAIEMRRRPLFALYALLKFPYIALLSLYEGARDSRVRRSAPRIVRFARPLYFASCYIVTGEGAKRLLELATPVVFPADRLPNQARRTPGFRMRAIAPAMARQERVLFGSDIG